MLPDWLLEVVLTEHGSFEAAERDYLARAHEKKMSVPSFEQVIFQFGMAVLSSDEHVRERFVAGVSALAPELAREEAILLMSMPFVVVVWGRSRDGMEKHAFVRKLPEDWRNRLGDLGLRIYTGIALGRLS